MQGDGRDGCRCEVVGELLGHEDVRRLKDIYYTWLTANIG